MWNRAGVGGSVCAQNRLPGGSWPTRRARVPDELRFRVHVPHPVLCKPLVQTVERGSQEAPDDPHHDEETQIHSCPEVTFFIGVSALREGVRERETKNHSAHENRKGQSGEETREAPPLRESQCRAERAAGAGDQRGSDTPPEAVPTLPITSLWCLTRERLSRVEEEILGGRAKHTLNSPKFSSPGSWKAPQLPN